MAGPQAVEICTGNGGVVPASRTSVRGFNRKEHAIGSEEQSGAEELQTLVQN